MPQRSLQVGKGTEKKTGILGGRWLVNSGIKSWYKLTFPSLNY